MGLLALDGLDFGVELFARFRASGGTTAFVRNLPVSWKYFYKFGNVPHGLGTGRGDLQLLVVAGISTSSRSNSRILLSAASIAFSSRRESALVALRIAVGKQGRVQFKPPVPGQSALHGDEAE